MAPKSRHSEEILTDPYDKSLQATVTKVYNKQAGGYNADDFVSASPEVAIVAGYFMGQQAEFIFTSTRVQRKKKALFYEQLAIHTDVGDLYAAALYEDAGDDVISTVESTDYAVVAANGCFDDLEGDNINITFKNNLTFRPRSIKITKGKGDRCKEEEKKEEGTSMKVFKWLVDKLL